MCDGGPGGGPRTIRDDGGTIIGPGIPGPPGGMRRRDLGVGGEPSLRMPPTPSDIWLSSPRPSTLFISDKLPWKYGNF